MKLKFQQPEKENGSKDFKWKNLRGIIKPAGDSFSRWKR
jgi:hypothetical protein